MKSTFNVLIVKHRHAINKPNSIWLRTLNIRRLIVELFTLIDQYIAFKKPKPLDYVRLSVKLNKYFTISLSVTSSWINIYQQNCRSIIELLMYLLFHSPIQRVFHLTKLHTLVKWFYKKSSHFKSISNVIDNIWFTCFAIKWMNSHELMFNE